MTTYFKKLMITALFFCISLCSFEVQAQPPTTAPIDDILPVPPQFLPQRPFFDSLNTKFSLIDCYDASPVSNCSNWGPWVLQSATATISPYDSCKILVIYRTRTCLDLGSTNFQMNIMGFSVKWVTFDSTLQPTYSQCNDLKNHLETLSGATLDNEVSNIEKQLYNKLSLHKFYEEDGVIYSNTGMHIKCDESSSAPGYDTPVFVSYYKGKCYGYYWAQLQIDHSDTPFELFIRKTCDDAVTCCKEWKTYCYDENDSLIVTSQVETETGSCTGFPNVDTLRQLFKEYFPLTNEITLPCTPSCDN